MSEQRFDQPIASEGRQIVLAILGMHRSGTSLAANIARRLGAATGKELIGPNEFNQLGYGEDVRIVRLHDALLAALDRSWATVKSTFPMPPDWTGRAEFATARDALSAYLRSEFSRAGGRIWAVKDPRMSMLLPLWLQLEQQIGFELVPVLCIRSPNAVAASIEKRDRMPPELGRLMWLQFNAAIVSQIGKRVKVVLNYDDWFDDPDRNLLRLAATLGRKVSDEERDEIVKELVSVRLRHHERQRADGLCGKWQALLEQWSKEESAPPSLREAADSLHEALEAFDPWRQMVADQDYLKAMIDAREKERAELLDAAERNRRAYQTMDAEFVAATLAIKRLEKERDDVHATADRHLEAYRTVEALAIRLQQDYRDLAYRYNLLLWRFDRFPLSFLVPEKARLRITSKGESADEQTDVK